jgi:hypothetical protein
VVVFPTGKALVHLDLHKTNSRLPGRELEKGPSCRKHWSFQKTGKRNRAEPALEIARHYSACLGVYLVRLLCKMAKELNGLDSEAVITELNQEGSLLKL